MRKITVFISKNKNRYRFRALGPVRLVPLLQEAICITQMGGQLAKSFFQNFIPEAHLQQSLSAKNYQGLTALYKDFSSSVNNMKEGIMGFLGFQLEIVEINPQTMLEERLFSCLLNEMEKYFTDTIISVGQNFVSNAFNIAGPYQQAPIKRDHEHEKRDTCPADFDFASVFYATGTLDPNSPLYGVTMCMDL